MRRFVNQAAALMVVAVIMLVCWHGVSALIPRATEFETARELRDFAVANGLVFHCGNGNGYVYNNYLLADHPIGIDDLEGVAMRGDCGLTPSWRGVVWVCQLGKSGLFLDSIGGKKRVWGNVLVAGDESLMDRIEDLYRNKPAADASRR